MKKIKPNEQLFLDMTNTQKYDECERIISKESLNDQTKTKLRTCLEFLLKLESIRTVNALRESQEMQVRIIELEKEIKNLKEKHLLIEDYQ